jgi:uncharacterized protein (DUF4415 family)
MAAKQLKGVGGVLGSLLSPSSTQTVTPEPENKPAEPARSEQTESPAVSPAKARPSAPARTQARRGRPPGKKTGEVSEKEKVTLRLSKELMDEYREWSWEERCQLGELVERALTQYRKNRSRSRTE